MIIHSFVRWGALFLLSVALNELFSIYIRPMHIALGWALTALWMVFDGVVVATQLAQAEARLKEQTLRADALQAEIATQSRTILNNSDTHALMCEIRQRVVAQGQRLKQHHAFATESFPQAEPRCKSDTALVPPPLLGEMRSRSESSIGRGGDDLTRSSPF